MNAAEVLTLETWRDPDGVLKRTLRRAPHPVEWADLLLFSAPGTRDKRTAIRTYAKLGLRPILLHGVNTDGSCTCGKGACTGSRGKHPVDKGWTTAPLDVDRLDQALEKNPVFNIGLAMGVQPGGFRLLAIDVDGPRETLAPLELELGALPPTLTSASGSGKGLHLIYRVDLDRKFPNSVRVAGHRVDIRCDGGQIVAAPSRHHTGGFYSWLDAREPAVLP